MPTACLSGRRDEWPVPFRDEPIGPPAAAVGAMELCHGLRGLVAGTGHCRDDDGPDEACDGGGEEQVGIADKEDEDATRGAADGRRKGKSCAEGGGG